MSMLLLIKILSQIAYPLLASLLLAIGAGLLLWRGRRQTGAWLLTIAIAWLWLWSTPVFGDWLRATLEQRYPAVSVDSLPTADAIVLLGGAVQPAAPPERPDPDLSAAADRVWHAARLYHAGKAPFILISGGKLPWSSADLPEAEAIADLLRPLGVPDSALILETHSRTTRENRDDSLPILHAHGAHRILLVTSALHMPRAMALFSKSELELIPAATDFEISRPIDTHPLRWFPDAQALADSTRAFKEYLGRSIVWLLD